jgi:hypothetical protein
MNVTGELFGSLRERFTYHEEEHAVYLNLFGISLNTIEDVDWYFSCTRDILEPWVAAKGPVTMVVNFDGFDVRKGLEEAFAKGVAEIEKNCYTSVKRYGGAAFRRATLGKQVNVKEWDKDELFELFDTNHNGELSLEELREGMIRLFQIQLTPTQLAKFVQDKEQTEIDRESFGRGLEECLREDGF